MINKTLVFLGLAASARILFAGNSATSLMVGEGFVDPIGFYDATPTLSWKLPEGVKKQTAYQITAQSEVSNVWNSGWVDSDQSVGIPYDGEPLRSRQRVTWKARYRDQDGAESIWSEPAAFELGLLSANDWKARWIHPKQSSENLFEGIQIIQAVYRVKDNHQISKDVTQQVSARAAKGEAIAVHNRFLGGDPAPKQVKELALTVRVKGQLQEVILEEKGEWPKAQEREPVAMLRREFNTDKAIQQARLYVTARGLFDVRLNGEKVGTDYFANGWTVYAQRLDTLTYDVTPQLKRGANTIGVQLACGWYSGKLHFQPRWKVFGEFPELLLQLEITYADGSMQTVCSDESWKSTFDGPIRFSSIYDGEEYDARREKSGWDQSGYNDANWGPVLANQDLGSARLTPKPFPPVRATGYLSVQEISEPQPGHFVFDLGQNMVGWAKLNIPVEKDRTVTIRFAEILNPDGTPYTINYRAALSTDTYTAAKTGTVEWEPTFTFHGFRYVELTGLPADVKPEKDWVTGVVLHSDLKRIGTFESSDPKLNRLYSNTVWGQRGNFLDIPTDCPQRDERFGWTGDAQVFAPTAMFNYDCHAFFNSWLSSMRDSQMLDGRIPNFIPPFPQPDGGSPGWQDVATIIPWEAYVRTGDPAFLSDNLDMMERMVGWYRNQAADNRISDIKAFGDWLQPKAKKVKGDTPEHLIGTAFYAHSAEILEKSLRVLGEQEETERLAAEVRAVKDAFADYYFDSNGRLKNSPETQTAYLLAIQFDLIPDELKEKAAKHLAALVEKADRHLQTGFLGTPYIVPVLDRTGRSDLALAVLFQETYPSWLYTVDQGATTMWERWNGYSHDEGIFKHKMNSFNHYAYGAIGQWLVERLAGLTSDMEHPGYKHFFIHPLIAPQLDWARAELETPYGRTVSGWKKENGITSMEVVVPPNSTATIIFPDGRENKTVPAGTYHF